MTCTCPTCGQSVQDTALIVDLNTNTAASGDRKVKLQPKEAELLKTLQDAYPRTIGQTHIEICLYGYVEEEVKSDCIKVFMSTLRKKIEGFPVKIENVHSTGWRLVECAA